MTPARPTIGTAVSTTVVTRARAAVTGTMAAVGTAIGATVVLTRPTRRATVLDTVVANPAAADVVVFQGHCPSSVVVLGLFLIFI